eukprot:GHVU01173308.1.p1 GENE.GHVU01173308.1~~GHVU01173308.1.p1  ORF type:complete len:337 (+),score=13.27 GHVU01173308.1:72-1013(+)
MGVVTSQEIPPGKFVIEYVGEVITNSCSMNRRLEYEGLNIIGTFMARFVKGYTIDATRFGNISRFINHSCEPNCECQLWAVGDRFRMGIFSRQLIVAGEELTYNYGDKNLFSESCLCGAASCINRSSTIPVVVVHPTHHTTPLPSLPLPPSPPLHPLTSSPPPPTPHHHRLPPSHPTLEYEQSHICFDGIQDNALDIENVPNEAGVPHWMIDAGKRMQLLSMAELYRGIHACKANLRSFERCKRIYICTSQCKKRPGNHIEYFQIQLTSGAKHTTISVPNTQQYQKKHIVDDLIEFCCYFKPRSAVTVARGLE